jgi:hypothetical protein
MANRPVFLPSRSSTSFVREIPVEFKWSAGLAVSQKQKSIASLHEAACKTLAIQKVLEISSKSADLLGVQLSAFNLALPRNGRSVSVEVIFQAGKKFANGGPFLDLLDGTSREAKKDLRLKNSGRLVEFMLSGESWPLMPQTAFYDWIYLQALVCNPTLAEQLLSYEAFTDIEFNPENSINCQARSAALYVSLERAGLIKSVLASKAFYLEVLSEGSSATVQHTLF